MSVVLDLFVTFLKIGATTFGGGYAMISILEHECVEKKGWLTADEMTDMTVIAESTPGPIAINCATFTGYKKARFFGALAATAGVVLPSFVILLLISFFFEGLLAYPVVASAFFGIRVAVALLILRVAVKMFLPMYKRARRKLPVVLFAAAAFAVVLAVGLLGAHISTIHLILVAGCAGICVFGILDRKDVR
ncbi:MAG: chromate transporter [Oscillospiraceae bacterium]|nr:chromate transporter [Oscillospiraceae bacterium]